MVEDLQYLGCLSFKNNDAAVDKFRGLKHSFSSTTSSPRLLPQQLLLLLVLTHAILISSILFETLVDVCPWICSSILSRNRRTVSIERSPFVFTLASAHLVARLERRKGISRLPELATLTIRN